MCLFETQTYLCGCPVKVSVFPPNKVNGKIQSVATSSAGKVCKTMFYPCGQKPCQAIFSKEVVTKKRDCSKCVANERYYDASQTPLSEDDEVSSQARLGLSETKLETSATTEQSTNAFIPVLGPNEDKPSEEEKKYQQDYQAFESGTKVLRLL